MTKVSTNDAQIKHIVLLTDGQDTYHGYDDLLKDMNDHKITLSTVAVGVGCRRKYSAHLSRQRKGAFLSNECGHRTEQDLCSGSIFVAGRIFGQQDFYTGHNGEQ